MQSGWSTLLPQNCDSESVAVKTKLDVSGSTIKVVVASAHLHYEEKVTIAGGLTKVIEYCRQDSFPVIISGDTTHAMLYEAVPTRTTEAHWLLMELLEGDIKNKADPPIFITQNRSEVIDILK